MTPIRTVRRTALTLLVLTLVWLPRVASACQITTANPAANFGSQASLNAGVGAQSTRALPNAGLTCPGSAIGVLTDNFYIRATISSANGLRLRHASGDTIAYAAYPTDSSQTPIFENTTYDYYQSGVLQLGSGGVSVPMSFRTPAVTGNLSAGTYTDTLTVAWSWRVCPLIGLAGACVGTPRTGSATSTINLTLTISPDCIIQAPDVDFGSAPLVAGFRPVTQTIAVRCTKGQSYSVGIGNGLHAAGNQRRMAAGASYLAYEIYQGMSSPNRWGNSGSARRASTSAEINPGVGTGNTVQGFTYRAEILPDQATPPPAAYSDTLVVDIAF